MKRLITPILLLTIVYSFGQGTPVSYGLEFDGQDDYAIYNVDNPKNYLINEFSFGATLLIYSLENHNTIISKPSSGRDGAFYLGVSDEGWLEMEINKTHYIAEGGYNLFNENCHHVAVTLNRDQVFFYVNGNLVATFNTPLSHHLDEIEYFYIGNYVPEINEHAFHGIIDDIRVWTEERTQVQIINNLTNINFNDNNLSQIYICSDFQDFGTGNHYYDLLSTKNFLELASGSYTPSFVQSCFGGSVEHSGFSPEGLATPSCPPMTGKNLVCNGNFELHDTIVSNNRLIPGIFAKFAHHLGTAGNVTNWTASNYTPDFFVRGDTLGGGIPHNVFTKFYSGTGFPGYPGGPNSVQTWNSPSPGNDAFAGLVSFSFAPGEGIKCSLYNSLKADSTYVVSFYSFSTTLLDTLNSSFDSHVTLKLHGSGQTFDIGGAHKLVNHTKISANNGWYRYSTTFTIPSNKGGVFDELEIRATGLYNNVVLNPGLPLTEYLYSFIDDVSLERVELPCTNSQFPVAIEQIDHHNQRYHRFQEFDANENIYVAGNSFRDITPNSHGYFLNKYSDCGDLEWALTSDPNRVLTSMVVDDNGYVYLALYDEYGSKNSEIIKYNNNGTLITPPTILGSSGAIAGRLSAMALNNTQNHIIYASDNRIEKRYTSDLTFVTNSSGIKAYEYIFQLTLDANDTIFIAGNPTNMEERVKIEKLNPAHSTNPPYTSLFSTFINWKPSPVPTLSGGYLKHPINWEKIQEMHVDGNGDLYVVGGYNDYISVPGSSPAFVKNHGINGSSGYSRSGYIIKFNDNLSFSWGKTMAQPTPKTYHQNPITSVATDVNDNVVVSGFFDTLYTNNQSYYTSNSSETFLLSYDANGTFRWFDQTKSPTGYTQFYYPEHCAVVNYQPVLDAFVVTGNFRQDSVELFDHGQLTTNSQNNVFICHAIDYGSGSIFKTHQVGSNNEQSNTTNQGFEGLENAAKSSGGFYIYPNPATNSIKVVLPSNIKGTHNMDIFDIRGGLVNTFELTGTEQYIQLPPLAKGIYYLRINDTNLAVQKLLIE